MARIRSIHPGLFTDEAFVGLSMPARMLLIGIWTDADDHGVFEWKPLSIKMRIFPADNIDVPALMEELATANVVKRFELDGRSYGAVRNFCKYQRPKKPSYKHELPHELRTYVALKDAGSPPVPHQFPTGGEKPPQMEDGIGVGGGESKKRRSLRSRGAALPDDWKPSDDDLAYGLSAGLSTDQIESAAEEMRLWAKGNSNRSIGRKADWSATFKGWLRRNYKGKPNGPPAKNGLAQALGKLREHVEHIDGGQERGDPHPRLLSHG